tara:strand:+ start:405 stop:710 length:306 start_codon:yes stop_codon:yes gene_type:complete
MAEFVLSYPFRIDPFNSRAGVVSTDTDTYKAEQVTAFCRTEKNERPIMPDYGITDPLFNRFDTGEFSEGFTNFYSSEDIKISAIQLKERGGRQTDVIIEFE